MPAICKLGRTVILWWRRRRLNRQLRQYQLDRVDQSFFVGGFFYKGGYEAYKRERAKHLKFPF